MVYKSSWNPRENERFSTRLMKPALVILCGAVLVYVFFHAGSVRKANLILSSSDIDSSDAGNNEKEFMPGKKVYFYVGRKYGNLNAGAVILHIEIPADGGYRIYKNIRFEVDEDFKRLNSYISGEYFKKPGKYRIRALLDNTEISSRDIEVK